MTVRIYTRWRWAGSVEGYLGWCWEEPDGNSVDGFSTAKEALDHWQQHGTDLHLPVCIEE